MMLGPVLSRPYTAGMTAEVLKGTWFIAQTSLPMWRKRQQPSVTYAPLPDGRVLDTVQFWQGGRSHLIMGVDSAQVDGSYHWRGLSLLTRLVVSRWRVLAAGDGWAITHFSRTPFTPAGVDVYSRTPTLTPRQQREVNVTLLDWPEVRAYLPELFTPPAFSPGFS